MDLRLKISKIYSEFFILFFHQYLRNTFGSISVTRMTKIFLFINICIFFAFCELTSFFYIFYVYKAEQVIFGFEIQTQHFGAVEVGGDFITGKQIRHKQTDTVSTGYNADGL